MRRLLFFLPALFIGAYFFYNAGLGLGAGFTQDDLMNMYRSTENSYARLIGDSVMFWRPSPVFRPFGALVYKASFDLAGLNLTGLSILRYLALCGNLLLLYALTRRLSGSRETGVLAALLLSYHLNYSDLYYNTGTLYDLFCFTFYFAALLLYVRIRQSGRFPAVIELTAIGVLFLLGLNAKEMAVTLPVLLLLYELIYHLPEAVTRHKISAWLAGISGALVAGAVISTGFALGRVMSKEGISSVGHYETVFSVTEYLRQTGHYLAELLYHPDTTLPIGATALFLAVLLVATLLLRSRVLGFASLLFAAGILPMAFIAWRGLNAVYIPLAGLAMAAAALLVAVKDLVTPWIVRLARRAGLSLDPLRVAAAGGVVLFVLVAATMVKIHPNSRVLYDAWNRLEYQPIGGFMRQLPRLHPKVSKTDRVLIVKDRFGQFNWASLFITRMVYRDQFLVVDRLASMDPKPGPAEIAKYTIRLVDENNKLRDATPAEALEAAR